MQDLLETTHRIHSGCSPTEERSDSGRPRQSPASEAGSCAGAAGLDAVVARMRELATNRGDALRRSRRDRGTLRTRFRDLVGVVEARAAPKRPKSCPCAAPLLFDGTWHCDQNCPISAVRAVLHRVAWALLGGAWATMRHACWTRAFLRAGSCILSEPQNLAFSQLWSHHHKELSAKHAVYGRAHAHGKTPACDRQEGAAPESRIKLRHGDTVVIDSLAGMVQLGAMRRTLAEGFQAHMQVLHMPAPCASFASSPPERL